MCAPSRRLLSRTFKFASSAGAIAAVFALALGRGLDFGEGPTKKRRGVRGHDCHWTKQHPGLETYLMVLRGKERFFSFDISFVDPVLNKYILADRSNKSIDILDL